MVCQTSGKGDGIRCKTGTPNKMKQLVIKCIFPMSKLESIILQGNLSRTVLYTVLYYSNINTADRSSSSVYFPVSYPYTPKSFIR